jgi:peptide subunit release factor 1 (eRF1)
VSGQRQRQNRSLSLTIEVQLNSSLYLCDNKFHTEALAELLESDSKFGFIVMDGNGTVSLSFT